MKKQDLLVFLREHPDTTVRFELPDGNLSPVHAHVTEVARIEKHFIDCGGTIRKESACRLQTWVADDFDHRLTARTLVGIIEKGAVVLGPYDLDMEGEHDIGFVSQFPVSGVSKRGAETIISLVGRHTECLAPEKCCPPQPESPMVTLGRKK